MGLTGRLDARRINAGFDSPIYYTPTPAGNESTNKISAYLKGIDNAIGAAIAVPGLTTQILFNDGNVISGSAGLVYNKTTSGLFVGGATQQGIFRVKAATNKNIMIHDHGTSGTITLTASNENNISLVGLELRGSSLSLLPDGGIIKFNNDGAYVNAGVLSVGYGSDTDGVEMWLCHGGYQGAYTRYRTVKIGDGRAGLVAEFIGSTKATNFYGTTTFNSGLKISYGKCLNGSGIFVDQAWGANCVLDTYWDATYGDTLNLYVPGNAAVRPYALKLTTSSAIVPGKLIVGNPDSFDGMINAGGAPFSDGEMRVVGSLWDTNTAYNASPKAGIRFIGKYNSSNNYAGFGGIQGIKENVTDGNYAGSLEFLTRVNGSALAVTMALSSTGELVVPLAANTTAHIGSGRMGAVWADHMTLSHENFHNATGYGFIQNNVGTSVQNAPTGQSAKMAINNIDIITVTTAHVEIAGTVHTNNYLQLANIAQPLQPTSSGRIYVGTDNKLYYLDASNIQYDLTSGGTNWQVPGTIGSTTPNTIAGTTGTFSGTLKVGGSTNTAPMAIRGGTDENFLVSGHILVSGAVALSAANNANNANVPFEYIATSHTWVDTGAIKMDLTGGNLSVVGTGTFNGATQNIGVGASFRDGISVAHRGAQVAIAASAILDYNPSANEGCRLMLFGPDNSTYSGEFSLRFMYANSGSLIIPFRVSPTNISMSGTLDIVGNTHIGGYTRITGSLAVSVADSLSLDFEAGTKYGRVLVSGPNASTLPGGFQVVLGHSDFSTEVDALTLTPIGATLPAALGINGAPAGTYGPLMIKNSSGFNLLSNISGGRVMLSAINDNNTANVPMGFRSTNFLFDVGKAYFSLGAEFSATTFASSAGGGAVIGAQDSSIGTGHQIYLSSAGGVTSINTWDGISGRSVIHLNPNGGGISVNDFIRMPNTSTPPAAIASNGHIFVNSSNKLIYRDGSGTDYDLTATDVTNWAVPGTLGSTTPNTIAGTSGTFSGTLKVGNPNAAFGGTFIVKNDNASTSENLVMGLVNENATDGNWIQQEYATKNSVGGLIGAARIGVKITSHVQASFNTEYHVGMYNSGVWNPTAFTVYGSGAIESSDHLIKQIGQAYMNGLRIQQSGTLDTWNIVHGGDRTLYFGFANNASGADADADFATRATLSEIGIFNLQAGSTSALPTYQGRLRMHGVAGGVAGLQAIGGIEWMTSAASAGYGWKVTSSDEGSSQTPLIIGSRTNSATWSEHTRFDNSYNDLRMQGHQLMLNQDKSTDETFVGTAWNSPRFSKGVSGGAAISYTRINGAAGPVGGDYIRFYTHRQSVSHALCGTIDENGTWLLGRGTHSMGPAPGGVGVTATMVLLAPHTGVTPSVWFDSGTNGQGCSIQNEGGNLNFYRGGTTAWVNAISMRAAGDVWFNQQITVATPSTVAYEVARFWSGAAGTPYITIGQDSVYSSGKAGFIGFNGANGTLYFGMHSVGNALEINTSKDVTFRSNVIVDGQAYSTTTALTDAASVVTDCNTGNVYSVTLAGNRTLANPTNLKNGATYIWVITQDATGSRTLAYGTAFKFLGGITPVLSTTGGSVDILSGVSDGTNIRCSLQKAFA